MINRRSLITGLISFAVTAPAIVRADSLMPVKVMTPIMTLDNYAKLINPMVDRLYQNWFLHQDGLYRSGFDNGEYFIEKVSEMDFYID